MRNEISVNGLGRPVMNKCLIKIKDTFDEMQTKSGITIKSSIHEGAWSDSTGHNVSDFIPRHGEVVRLPRLISRYGFDYDTENELEIGDTVFWNLTVCMDMQILVCDGEKYALIDYHGILIRVRNGVITPINGYVLLSPVSKTVTALSYSKTQEITDIWKIKQLPDKDAVSTIPRRNTTTPWEAGDQIKIMVGMSPYKIEGDLNKVLSEDLYCVPKFMVLCTVK